MLNKEQIFIKLSRIYSEGRYSIKTLEKDDDLIDDLLLYNVEFAFFIIDIEEEFKINIEEKDALSFKKIDDLVNYIYSNRIINFSELSGAHNVYSE